MARFTEWIAQSFPNMPDDDLRSFEGREQKRKYTVYRIQRDLYDAAVGLGQTPTQAIAKIDDLFATFAGEWSLWILTESPAIITAIQNDATLAWLDTIYPPGSGVSIRTRLINRLT